MLYVETICLIGTNANYNVMKLMSAGLSLFDIGICPQ